jgi:hypothetical protein
MTRRLKRALAAAATTLLGLCAVAAGCAHASCSRYDASMSKVYDLPVANAAHSEDPAVIARGEHLVESIGNCASFACHGGDLGGGQPLEMGPALGTIAAPNITSAGVLPSYSDGELLRLFRYGIKKDGHSVRLMPSQDFGWLPDRDMIAIVSYLRAARPVARRAPSTEIRGPIKLLDGAFDFPVDVARRVDPAAMDGVPAPEPTAAYGAFIARLCRECHGEHFTGGRIPGLPPIMTTPLNLTPDPTGLEGWTFEDFDRTMRAGVRKNGRPLTDFMPIDSWRNLDDVEMRALWAYLGSLPPKPFGGR